MDRRVKERLIGASILVALVVLVVPELLSGPKPNAAPAPTLPAAAPEPIRNVTVDLTTSKAPANSEVEPAEQPATSAASSAANLAEAQPPPAQTPAAQAPAAQAPAVQVPAALSPVPLAKGAAARHPPVESAAPSPKSTGLKSWSVQLGSFASRANADNLTRQVKGQGFSVFVLAGGSGASVRYRVRVGPLSDRESAERMAAKLKSLGHAGSLVAPAA
jgi:DedD protein